MNSLSLLAWLILWPASGLQAGSPQQVTFIEQEFSLQSSEGQQISGRLSIWFDDHRLRSEVTTGDRKSVALIDLDAGEVTLVFTQERSWLKLKLEEYLKAVAARLGIPKSSATQSDATLQTMAEPERVGPWQCRRLVFRLSGPLEVESDIWVTEQTGIDSRRYLTMLERLGLERLLGLLPGHIQALGGLPVQSTTRQKISGVTMESRHLVKTAEKKAREAGLFEIPTGYRQLAGEAVPETRTGGAN